MFNKIVEILHRINMGNLRLEDLSESSELVNDIGLSSLSIIMLIGEIESEFGVELSDYLDVITLGDVCSLLADKVPGQ